MIKIVKKWFDLSIVDKLAIIGNILFGFYIPLIICLIWFDTLVPIKLILINTVILSFGCFYQHVIKNYNKINEKNNNQISY